MSCKVSKTFLHRIKTGEGAKHGKVRRPNMSRHIDRLRANFQNHLQQIVAAHTKNRSAVGMDIPDFFQFPGDHLRLFEIGKQNQTVYLPHFPVLLINRADLPGNHKPRDLIVRRRIFMNPVFLFQNIESVFIPLQLFL